MQRQREPDTGDEPEFKVFSLDKLGKANKDAQPKPKNPSGWEDVTGPLWRQNFEYHEATNIVRCKICGVTARGLYFSNLKVHLNAKHTVIAECMNASIKKFADPEDMWKN